MVHVAVLVIVSLLAPPLMPICGEQAPAAHDCCRKAPRPTALKMQPCCITPDTAGLPAAAAMTAPTPRMVATAMPAVAPPDVALRHTNDLRLTPARSSPAYLRHVALLI